MVKQIVRLSLSLILGSLIFTTCEDTTPPTVSITSPQDGSTVNEIVTITCILTDNKGIEKVELWVDGVSTGVTDNTVPYSFEWNTTTYDDGSYTITVRSYDNSGNMTDSDPITLIVDNSDSYPTPIELYPSIYLNNSFIIIWTKSPDKDFNSYKLFESLIEDMSVKTLIFDTNTISDTFFVVTGISENVVRYYQVIVEDKYGFKFSSSIETGSSALSH